MKMNVVRAFFGYLTFSARFLDATNSPTNCDPNCYVPEGGFLDSCTEPRMNVYQSADEIVPKTCKLIITCNTYYESMPPITGNYYLPMLTLIRDVSNVNGTLYCKDGSVLGTKKPEPLLDVEGGPNMRGFMWPKEDEATCQQPYGSYEDTCKEVTVKPYVSQDFELQESPLCIAETTCTTVAAKEKSSATVYYKKAEERFENCNGIILVHSKGQKDNVCKGKTELEIKKIIDSELYGKVSKPRP